MNHHEHYGDWTIQWWEEAPERFKFWIDTRICLPGRGQVELFGLFVQYFESPQMGCYRCRQIIDLIVCEQRELFARVTAAYLDGLKPPAPTPDPIAADREDDDLLPF